MAESELMTGVDAAWLHMDRPENTADVVALMLFRDRVPFKTVRRLIEDRLVRLPRFTQLIRHDGLLSLASWVPDPDFDLSRHLLSRRVKGRLSRSIDRFASEVATEELDKAHPLWRAYLVHDDEGESALVTKLHHCIADGFALVGVLLSLADEVREPVQARPHRMPTYRDLRVSGDLSSALMRAIFDPGEARRLASKGVAFASSLARLAALPAEPPSLLGRPLSGKRRMAWWRGVKFDDMRALARREGGTVNDVVLAALAGALRGYLSEHGEEVDHRTLRALVPVNLRTTLPDQMDGALGNCFGLVFLDLPIHLASPKERMEALKEHIAAVKKTPDAVATYGVLAAIGRLPGPVEQAVLEFFSSKASLVVTNVPGPKDPLHLAGHEIRRLQFCVPHPARLGLGVSILSYAGEVSVGIRADVAVLPEPRDLLRRLRSEILALEALDDVA